MLSFLKSLGISFASLAGSVLVLNPLVNGPFDRPGASIADETLGVIVVGGAVLALLVAPALFILNRAVGRLGIPRVGWAIIGSLVAISPWVALGQTGRSVLEKIATTFEFLQTVRGIAAWGPYLVGGAILGWNMFTVRRAAKP